MVISSRLTLPGGIREKVPPLKKMDTTLRGNSEGGWSGGNDASR
jgi:hypothetical protein